MEKIHDAKKYDKFIYNDYFDNNISILDIILHLKSAYYWNWSVKFIAMEKCRQFNIPSLLCEPRGATVLIIKIGCVFPWLFYVFFNCCFLAIPFEIDEHILLRQENTKKKNKLHINWLCRTRPLCYRFYVGLL